MNRLLGSGTLPLVPALVASVWQDDTAKATVNTVSEKMTWMNVGRMMMTFLDSDELMTFDLIIAD